MADVDEVLAWFEEFGITGERAGVEFKTLCPFHAEDDPSCGINLEKRVFRCYGCSAKGDIFSFLAAKLHTTSALVKKQLGIMGKGKGSEESIGVSMDLVLQWHRELLKSKKWLTTLRHLKGITHDTIEEYMIGVEDNRVTLPVLDRRGEIVNVRKWSPKDKKRKVISMTGRGKAQLYPLKKLAASVVIITEGELKALLLCQLGFDAITPTGGAGTWNVGWNGLFEGKVVYIIYDIDKAGQIGANKIAKNLFPVVSAIYIVKLPISSKEFPAGDVTDFILTLGHEVDDIKNLLDATPKWTQAPLAEGAIEDTTVYPLHLAETSKAQWCDKLIACKVIVSAKDTAPYILPKKFQVFCPKDKDYCVFCPVFNAERKEDKAEFQIMDKDPLLLEMVNTRKDRVDKCVKRAVGIPKPCEACKFKITETMNVEEVRLIPTLSITTRESEHVVRRAFHIGHGIETNTQYEIEARVVPEPNTQYATLLVYDKKASVDSLSEFKLDDAQKVALRAFTPAEWTSKSIAKKLNDIYADFEANVTRIYARRDMHLFYDLVYHSVLYIMFQDKLTKGWVEGLVLGDSGQGKSETIKYMMEHYGLGEKVDSKGATVAGLLGGLQETAKRWFVSWGIITLNDRRLVVLEEIKGMAEEVIARLTDMRSSGIAEIPKIEKARANARCRLIWISNPRSDRQVLSYNYGVEAVRELIGALEDVRRFDMALIISSGEIDQKYLNLSTEDRPHYPHKYTAQLCRNLVLWAWSRTETSVQIPSATEKAILKSATEMGQRYTSRIPLVEAADQRIKIMRLATALAARTFSTDDGENLIVRECHVEFITQFLNKLYSSPCSGYHDYSALIKNEDNLHDEKELTTELTNLPHAKDVVRAMLDSPGFSPFDLMDWSGVETDKARTLIGLLVRKNALKKGRRAYVKTPPFIALLKKLQMNGQLTNESAYEQSKQEEF